MAVYSTDENKKDLCLQRTLRSLERTVNFQNGNRLILSINAKTKVTDLILHQFRWIISDVIENGENIGTAKAINKAWAQRLPEEHCVKMDDDVEIFKVGWLDELQEAVLRDPEIGQIGLKRKDVWEHPKHENPDLRSELIMLPHVGGETWIVVEKVKHVIGTCVLHSSPLLDKHSGEQTQNVINLVHEMYNGTKPIYYDL